VGRAMVIGSIVLLSSLMLAQDATVRGQVKVLHQARNQTGSGDVVVWLTPGGSATPANSGTTARLIQ
jgi:hypothetical protein